MADSSPDRPNLGPKKFSLELSPAAETLLLQELYLLKNTSRVQWATQILNNALLREGDRIRREFEIQAKADGHDPEKLLSELRQPKKRKGEV